MNDDPYAAMGDGWAGVVQGEPMMPTDESVPQIDIAPPGPNFEDIQPQRPPEPEPDIIDQEVTPPDLPEGGESVRVGPSIPAASGFQPRPSFGYRQLAQERQRENEWRRQNGMAPLPYEPKPYFTTKARAYEEVQQRRSEQEQANWQEMQSQTPGIGPMGELLWQPRGDFDPSPAQMQVQQAHDMGRKVPLHIMEQAVRDATAQLKGDPRDAALSPARVDYARRLANQSVDMPPGPHRDIAVARMADHLVTQFQIAERESVRSDRLAAENRRKEQAKSDLKKQGKDAESVDVRHKEAQIKKIEYDIGEKAQERKDAAEARVQAAKDKATAAAEEKKATAATKRDEMMAKEEETARTRITSKINKEWDEPKIKKQYDAATYEDAKQKQIEGEVENHMIGLYKNDPDAQAMRSAYQAATIRAPKAADGWPDVTKMTVPQLQALYNSIMRMDANGIPVPLDPHKIGLHKSRQTTLRAAIEAERDRRKQATAQSAGHGVLGAMGTP